MEVTEFYLCSYLGQLGVPFISISRPSNIILGPALEPRKAVKMAGRSCTWVPRSHWVTNRPVSGSKSSMSNEASARVDALGSVPILEWIRALPLKQVPAGPIM